MNTHMVWGVSLWVGLTLGALMSFYPREEPPEKVSAAELVQHYRTKGIKFCGGDGRERGERTGAVLLQDGERTAMIAFLRTKFDEEIDEVLFTHVPEATSKWPGQPALIAVKRDGESYCVQGIGGSYSTEPFVSFEAKYGSQLKK